ncbi:MAG: invasion associated locus B family protein, partial [Rhodospirillales bacterium]
YVYRKDSEVTVNIDGQLYNLFTDRGTAWARDAKADLSISRMMIRGKSMTVTGFSARGTKTEDTYSLAGFTAAYNAIGKACGIK